MTGRGLVLGGLRDRGEDAAPLFTGEGHAPVPLSETERAAGRPPEGNEALDCPDWLAPALADNLGADFAPVMQTLRRRAPVFLRVNLRKATRDAAQARLAEDGIETAPHPLSPTALEVLEGARRIQASDCYAEGWVELQDAASQAITDLLPLADGARVLDYCAGGGGKTLSMAGRVRAAFHAHDASPGRMRDLPARAARAGVRVTLVDDPVGAAPFDLVLCDVPCSGSGAWRRSPEGKWRLNLEELARLETVQAEILTKAASLVKTGGVLAYATCSLLQAENDNQIKTFLSHNDCWALTFTRVFTPRDGGDGFYISVLTHRA
jgi:16S rRNA (cytosine967-C5)-methyltransferase